MVLQSDNKIINITCITQTFLLKLQKCNNNLVNNNFNFFLYFKKFTMEMKIRKKSTINRLIRKVSEHYSDNYEWIVYTTCSVQRIRRNREIYLFIQASL